VPEENVSPTLTSVVRYEGRCGKGGSEIPFGVLTTMMHEGRPTPSTQPEKRSL